MGRAARASDGSGNATASGPAGQRAEFFHRSFYVTAIGRIEKDTVDAREG